MLVENIFEDRGVIAHRVELTYSLIDGWEVLQARMYAWEDVRICFLLGSAVVA